MAKKFTVHYFEVYEADSNGLTKTVAWARFLDCKDGYGPSFECGNDEVGSNNAQYCLSLMFDYLRKDMAEGRKIEFHYRNADTKPNIFSFNDLMGSK